MAKFILIIFSLFIGKVFYDATLKGTGSYLFSIFSGIGSSFLYIAIGALVVRFLRGMENWAFEGQRKDWVDEESQMFGAILWPVVFVFGVPLYIYLGVINRLFR